MSARANGMRRVTVKAFGDPEQVALDAAEVPRPGPGKLLVDVGAAGINYLDVYQRSGRYELPRPGITGLVPG
jgi:NADPH2:quinone reductase